MPRSGHHLDQVTGTELESEVHLTHRMMISWSKCRPLNRSCAEVGSVLVQSLNLGPIWQASDSLSPRAPGSARRPFLKFAPEPSCARTPLLQCRVTEFTYPQFSLRLRKSNRNPSRKV